MNGFASGLDPVLDALFRIGLCAIFLGACIHKARDLDKFSATLGDYRLLPRHLSGVATRALATSEAIVALALLMPPLDPLGPLGSLGLFALYSAAIGINLARGRRHIDCGCTGFGQVPQTISGMLLVRNAGLAMLALALLAPAAARPLAWLDFISIAGGLILGALVWLAAHELGRTPPPIPEEAP
ncbi:MAG: hypothetical protein OSB70_04895 [Myxococcota bacterium]|jgi:hypothetical protein|nr:hypothetical protein [Myxococcota bacterium]